MVSVGAVAAQFGTSVVTPRGSQGVRTEFMSLGLPTTDRPPWLSGLWEGHGRGPDLPDWRIIATPVLIIIPRS